MLNIEKYKDEITCIMTSGLALVDGKPTDCRWTDCADCDMGNENNCAEKILDWLTAEYQEPKGSEQ